MKQNRDSVCQLDDVRMLTVIILTWCCTRAAAVDRQMGVLVILSLDKQEAKDCDIIA